MNHIEIAEKLAPLYGERSKLQFSKTQLEKQLEKRREELIFTGEVEGKDADARKLARAAKQAEIYRQDAMLSTGDKALADLDWKLSAVQIEIDAIETFRRGLEWQTRRGLAEALGAEFPEYQDDAPFDKAEDEYAEGAAMEDAGVPQPAPTFGANDEIPF